MPKEILLPELAESIVEGEIQKWLVKEGDLIAKDQLIVEVMTDKATIELPSPFGGVVHKLLVREGETVAVHAPIAIVLEPGETPPSDAPAQLEGADAHEASLFKPSEQHGAIKNPFLERRVRATPQTRKAARDLGVDLGTITGSGPSGRIRADDLKAGPGPAAPGFPKPVQYKTPAGYETLEERVPLRGIRRAIAEQMTASHLHTVRTLVVDEADLTLLGGVRAKLKPEAEARGIHFTYLPFVFRAVAGALAEFPPVNSSLDERTQEIVLKRYYHLGMAVATDAGLVVPVIRDVPGKSLLGLAAEIAEVAERARQGKLSPAELTGSCFTITSIGNVGTLFSFPIINVPDAAILGVHTVQRRAVVIDEGEGEGEKIVARSMVYLSLSFDHRLIDGATAAEFLRAVIRALEDPGRLALDP